MTQNKKSDFLTVAIGAAHDAGSFIMKNLGTISSDDIKSKKASDFVTHVDRESEQIIIETVKKHFPAHFFLAEESIHEAAQGEFRWIIDPLDGTTNYIHGYPVFSVSIALEYRGEMILGVVFDPMRHELFTAEKGKGAYVNTSHMSVSSVTSLRHALITTGFPFRQKEHIDSYLKLFKTIFHKVSDIRRAGSAALDLAHLACGRCDGFFEIGLSPWDIAAGSIMIREAGGIVTDFAGGEEYLSTGNIIAGNPLVQRELLQSTKSVFKRIIDR
jgi:myo-inositol-1(or 4)-monophosphatase